jgi:hypothetical protein
MVNPPRAVLLVPVTGPDMEFTNESRVVNVKGFTAGGAAMIRLSLRGNLLSQISTSSDKPQVYCATAAAHLKSTARLYPSRCEWLRYIRLQQCRS